MRRRSTLHRQTYIHTRVVDSVAGIEMLQATCCTHAAHVCVYVDTANSSYANSSGGGILESRTVAKIVANNTMIVVVVVAGDFVDNTHVSMYLCTYVCASHLLLLYAVLLQLLLSCVRVGALPLSSAPSAMR